MLVPKLALWIELPTINGKFPSTQCRVHRPDGAIEWKNSLMEHFGFLKLTNDGSYFFFSPRKLILFCRDSSTRCWSSDGAKSSICPTKMAITIAISVNCRNQEQRQMGVHMDNTSIRIFHSVMGGHKMEVSMGPKLENIICFPLFLMPVVVGTSHLCTDI